jgi:hypothetical protein
MTDLSESIRVNIKNELYSKNNDKLLDEKNVVLNTLNMNVNIKRFYSDIKYINVNNDPNKLKIPFAYEYAYITLSKINETRSYDITNFLEICKEKLTEQNSYILDNSEFTPFVIICSEHKLFKTTSELDEESYLNYKLYENYYDCSFNNYNDNKLILNGYKEGKGKFFFMRHAYSESNYYKDVSLPGSSKSARIEDPKLHDNGLYQTKSLNNIIKKLEIDLSNTVFVTSTLYRTMLTGYNSFSQNDKNVNFSFDLFKMINPENKQQNEKINLINDKNKDEVKFFISPYIKEKNGKLKKKIKRVFDITKDNTAVDYNSIIIKLTKIKFNSKYTKGISNVNKTKHYKRFQKHLKIQKKTQKKQTNNSQQNVKSSTLKRSLRSLGKFFRRTKKKTKESKQVADPNLDVGTNINIELSELMNGDITFYNQLNNVLDVNLFKKDIVPILKEQFIDNGINVIIITHSGVLKTKLFDLEEKVDNTGIIFPYLKKNTYLYNPKDLIFEEGKYFNGNIEIKNEEKFKNFANKMNYLLKKNPETKSNQSTSQSTNPKKLYNKVIAELKTQSSTEQSENSN